jgi:hypothetical protein
LLSRDGFFAFQLTSKHVFRFFLFLGALVVLGVDPVEVVVAGGDDVGLVVDFPAVLLWVVHVECFRLFDGAFELLEAVVIAVELFYLCLELLHL